jgi:hypothetical protein
VPGDLSGNVVGYIEPDQGDLVSLGVEEDVSIESPGIVPVLVIDPLEFFFTHVPGDPPIECLLVLLAEHLQAHSGWDACFIDGPDNGELNLMVVFLIVAFSDKYQSDSFQVVHNLSKGYLGPVGNPQECVTPRTVVSKEETNRHYVKQE